MRRIKELREDSDLKQETIAKIIGISQTNYSKIELGKIRINIEDLRKLCLFYGVSADYVLELPKGLKYIER